MIKHGHIYAIPRQFLIAWIASFVCMLALTMIAIRYANYVDEQSNKRWCGVVLAIDKAYTDDPPATPNGKVVAAEMRNLRKRFKECS